MYQGKTVKVACSYCGKTFDRFLSHTINPKTGQPRKKAKCPDCKCVDPKVLFWKKVDKTSSTNGCWLWTGATNPEGYGQFVNRAVKDIRAHRIAWTFLKGPIPEGMHALHKCPNGHNRLCVNPDHIYLGTQSENNRDAVEQGTYNRPSGENHYYSQLTEEAVRDIRTRYSELAKHHNVKKLTEIYGVSVATIRDVASRRSWKHVI